MIAELFYLLCGFAAGLLGGYLGLGGGEIMVPVLTIVLGVDIRTAVPVSVTAVVVNALSSSTEYLRRGMVDLELVVILSVFMVMGNIVGSTVSVLVSENVVRLLLTLLLVYTAFTLIKGRSASPRLAFADNRRKYMWLAALAALCIGTLAGLLGVGGGVFLMPLIYLVIGCPLSTARGTTALIITLSSSAAAAVYFLHDAISFHIVAPVILGILLGGRAGGFLGTMAKPIVIRILFFVVMLYLAWRMAAGPITELL